MTRWKTFLMLLVVIVFMVYTAFAQIGSPATPILSTLQSTIIAFSTASGIWTADGDGKNAHLVISSRGRFAGMPAISPDGHWIAFVANWSGSDQIWIAPINGLFQIRLTNGEFDSEPAWSPDGRNIAYLANDISKVKIIPINAIFNRHIKPKRLTKSAYSVSEGEPCWISNTDVGISSDVLHNECHSIISYNIKNGSRKIIVDDPEGKIDCSDLCISDHGYIGYTLDPSPWNRPEVYFRLLTDSGLGFPLVDGTRGYFPCWHPNGYGMYFTSSDPSGVFILFSPLGSHAAFPVAFDAWDPSANWKPRWFAKN